ncbi:MAG: PIN domain-containing protein [Nitrososphaerales archaeon]|nr:PIN domain-containing protein [Nitrososphaerales archaeon]
MIDTFAWVEYLLGSKAGQAARKYIEGGGAITPSAVLAELKQWYLKEIESGRRTEGEMRSHLAFVESRTRVVPLDARMATKAGETDFLMKKRIKGWPMADSIILATANAQASRVVTGDPHFRQLEDVVYIG